MMVVCKQTLVFIFCPLVEMNKNLDMVGSINFELVQGDLRLFIGTMISHNLANEMHRNLEQADMWTFKQADRHTHR